MLPLITISRTRIRSVVNFCFVYFLLCLKIPEYPTQITHMLYEWNLRVYVMMQRNESLVVSCTKQYIKFQAFGDTGSTKINLQKLIARRKCENARVGYLTFVYRHSMPSPFEAIAYNQIPLSTSADVEYRIPS